MQLYQLLSYCSNNCSLFLCNCPYLIINYAHFSGTDNLQRILFLRRDKWPPRCKFLNFWPRENSNSFLRVKTKQKKKEIALYSIR